MSACSFRQWEPVDGQRGIGPAQGRAIFVRMTAITGSLPVDDLIGRARKAPGARRVLMTAVAALFAGLGWVLGRGLVVLGWIAGRTWISLAYMAEAVIWGFRNGAGLPQPGDAAAKAAAESGG